MRLCPGRRRSSSNCRGERGARETRRGTATPCQREAWRGAPAAALRVRGVSRGARGGARLELGVAELQPRRHAIDDAAHAAAVAFAEGGHAEGGAKSVGQRRGHCGRSGSAAAPQHARAWRRMQPVLQRETGASRAAHTPRAVVAWLPAPRAAHAPVRGARRADAPHARRSASSALRRRAAPGRSSDGAELSCMATPAGGRKRL